MGKTSSLLVGQIERRYEPLWKVMRERKITQSLWIEKLRQAMNMSARQLGERMGIRLQSVRDMERREAEGSITLATLHKAADALGMDLFYAFVPKQDQTVDHPLERIVHERALEVACKIIERTATTMLLEDQATGQEAREKTMKRLAADLVREMPRSLWDLN